MSEEISPRNAAPGKSTTGKHTITLRESAELQQLFGEVADTTKRMNAAFQQVCELQARVVEITERIREILDGDS